LGLALVHELERVVGLAWLLMGMRMEAAEQEPAQILELGPMLGLLVAWAL